MSKQDASNKQIMELNGVANLLLILQSSPIENVVREGGVAFEQAIMAMEEQLDLLERYMVAFNKSIQEGTQNPYWHEIKANPNQYPLNGNRKPKL